MADPSGHKLLAARVLQPDRAARPAGEDGGDYADPAMKLVLLAADDIEAVEETAEELLESKTSAKKTNGGTLVAKEIAYSLNFDDSQKIY